MCHAGQGKLVLLKGTLVGALKGQQAQHPEYVAKQPTAKLQGMAAAERDHSALRCSSSLPSSSPKGRSGVIRNAMSCLCVRASSLWQHRLSGASNHGTTEVMEACICCT